MVEKIKVETVERTKFLISENVVLFFNKSDSSLLSCLTQSSLVSSLPFLNTKPRLMISGGQSN